MTTNTPADNGGCHQPYVGSPAPRMLVAGDPVPALTQLRFCPATQQPGEIWDVQNIRTIVIGVDLSFASSRRTLRRALRRYTALCVSLCNRLPHVAHVVFVTDGATPRVEAWANAAGDQSSRSTRALLEQSCGADIAVTLIVADSCDNASLLAERIAQRTRRAPGIDASTAVAWRELAHDPLGQERINQLL